MYGSRDGRGLYPSSSTRSCIWNRECKEMILTLLFTRLCVGVLTTCVLPDCAVMQSTGHEPSRLFVLVMKVYFPGRSAVWRYTNRTSILVGISGWWPRWMNLLLDWWSMICSDLVKAFLLPYSVGPPKFFIYATSMMVSLLITNINYNKNEKYKIVT